MILLHTLRILSIIDLLYWQNLYTICKITPGCIQVRKYRTPFANRIHRFSLEKILDCVHLNNIITTSYQYSRFWEIFERFGTVINVSSSTDTSVEIHLEGSKAKPTIPSDTAVSLHIWHNRYSKRGLMLSDRSLVVNGELILVYRFLINSF